MTKLAGNVKPECETKNKKMAARVIGRGFGITTLIAIAVIFLPLKLVQLVLLAAIGIGTVGIVAASRPLGFLPV